MSEQMSNRNAGRNDRVKRQARLEEKRRRIRRARRNRRIVCGLFLALVVVIGVITVPKIAKEFKQTEATVPKTTVTQENIQTTTQETQPETTTAEPESFSPVDYVDASAQVTGFSGNLTAKDAILINVNTKEILYEKNADTQTPPASTTKLMTAMTALTYLDPDDKITIGDEINMISEGSSVAYLAQGVTLSVRQILQGLMLSSGNDAAYVLAVNAARAETGNDQLSNKQAVKEFVRLMNENVEKMGLSNTHFASPDGFDTDNQYTSARDLSMIAYEAIQNKEIMKAVSKHSVYVKELGVTWTSTNELTNPDGQYYYDKVIGLKTGSTPNAGKCLVAVAKDGDEEYLSVVLGSDDEGRWKDSTKLLKFGFKTKE